MVGGNRIIAIGSGGSDAASDEFLLTEEATSPALETWEPEWDDPGEAATGRRRELLGPIAAMLAIALWTGFFAWSQRNAMAPTPEQWAGWIRDWSAPVLLICVVWLLAMRNSRREAIRFGDAAALLSQESARLESRLAAVNGELSLAREFIAAQARDLEALGRLAGDRLSQNAERLQSLIRDNTAQIHAIGDVSETALANMEKLRSQLPVIANSARDVTNNIGNAGRTAHVQLEEMIGGFKRINEFGVASERQVETLRELVNTSLSEFNTHSAQVESVAAKLHTKLDQQGTTFRAQLEADEADALATIRSRADALARELLQARGELASQEAKSLQSLQSRIDTLRDEGVAVSASLHDRSSAAAEDLTARFAKFDEQISARYTRHDEHIRDVAAHSQAVAAQFAEIGARLGTIVANSHHAEASIARGTQGLAERLEQSHASLSETSQAIEVLTDSSVRLLELIQAGSQHSRVDLPAALGEAEGRLGTIEARIGALGVAASDTASHGERLHGHVLAAQEGLVSTSREMETMHARLTAQAGGHSQALDGLRTSLEAIEAQSRQLAGHAQSELAAAIEQLSGAARGAVAGIGDMSAASIAQIAERLGQGSAAAIDKAMASRTADAAGLIEQAAARAADVSRETAVQLRDQLAKVDELAGNLERRVAHARQRAEEQIDNDFARRVTLITESLNSNAIDIARAIDTDVSDTAWAAYLKGDRGIFTRRAVSLVEGGEAKSIAQIYEHDPEFREHVNRYIHDFEAMLRQVLSTRDGHALGVTLLSSDMGKLYVAVAQAIERLRS